MERKKGVGWRNTHAQTGSSSLLWSLLLSGAEVSGAKDEVEGRREGPRSKGVKKSEEYITNLKWHNWTCFDSP